MFGIVIFICAGICFTVCGGQTQEIVSLNRDFNKLEADPELKKHVSEILVRLNSFHLGVHPRIRLIYEFLKLSMNQYAQRTADSLYIPDKYNVAVTANKKS